MSLSKNEVLSGIFSCDLGEAVPHHQLTQHFPASTYALLRVLRVAFCGLFLRIRLPIVDSARDVSNNQWVGSVPCDYLFDVSFGFL